MKLCHIVPSLEEQHGGPSKSVRSVCAALAQAGNSVSLFAASPHAPKSGIEAHPENGLTVRRFQRNWPGRICRSTGLSKALSRLDAEIVHHHSLWLRTTHYAHQYARGHNVPLVISPRGMMSPWALRHHKWRKRLARLLIHPGALNATSGWHVTSEDEARDIRDLGFKQPLCVAPNGVNAPTAVETTAATAHWRSVCPEVGTRPVALFYGRFHQKKRVIELIDVWLEQAPPDWLLLMVGIPEEYTPEMLDRYVLRVGGTGRVRVFSGAGLPPPYSVANLFLLPSHTENFGLTVAEAMANGVPAVVTDTTPWKSLNVEERGWCVAWNNYEKTLAAATRQNVDELREKGARAREWVLMEFSWTRAAETLNDFYRQLRDGSAAGRF